MNDVVTLRHVRVFPGAKADKEQRVKVLEEAAEFHAAAQEHEESLLDKEPLFEVMMVEYADLVQAATNYVVGAGATQSDIMDAFSSCEAKNAARGRYDKPQAQSLIERVNEVCS